VASWVNTDGEQIDSPALRIHNSLAGVTEKDALDRVCLDFIRRGGSAKGMAKFLKCSARTIERRVERALIHEEHRKSAHRDPIVEPIFGVQPHTPTSPCAHPVPFPEGAMEYCPNRCHKTGVEGHPSLKMNPGDYEAPMITKTPDDGKLGGTDKKQRKPKSASARKRQRAAV
jgi:hypothetical protein